MNQILAYVGFLILLLNLIVFAKGFFNSGKAFKIYTFYLLVIFIIQMASNILAELRTNNLFLSHFYFILQFIADEEKIELDETAFETRLNGIAEQSQQPIDEVRRVFEDDLRESMLEKQTIDFLIANAKYEEN